MITERPTRHPNINSNEDLSRLLGRKVDERLDEFEAEIQKEMIRTLKTVGIRASVKRDRFSLPYTNEKIVIVPFVSYLNAVFNYSKAFRPFVKELLDNDVHHIRLYIWTDLFERGSLRTLSDSGLKYHFRYYVHH